MRKFKLDTAPSRRGFLGGLAATTIRPSTAGAATMAETNEATHPAPSTPIIVFDVNETLLDFTVLEPVFARVFDDAGMARSWFNQVVLYSEALTLAGQYVDSGLVGVAVLEMLAKIKGRVVAASDLAELKRLSGAMPTYPDTPPALASLKAAGFRLVTLSNNPTSAVEAQLTAAGLRAFFDSLHSIDDGVRRYKPARESYLALATTLGVAPAGLWLVSCHAFDTLGAGAAGYRTALVQRPENAPIALGRPPNIVAQDLGAVADQLVRSIKTPHRG